MKKNKKYIRKEQFEIIDKRGRRKKITGYKIKHDRYGNPRYVFDHSHLDMSLKQYVKGIGNKGGMSKYRGKWFGGGLVAQMYGDSKSLQNAYDKIHKYDRPNSSNRVSYKPIRRKKPNKYYNLKKRGK